MKRVGVFIVLLFIVLSNFTYAGDSQAESTVSPSDVSTSVGGPEANLESVDYFNNDIDLFTGEVAFPLPVASLPGRDGLGYDLNIFYSSRSVDAYSNNGLSPTGVLGLGWNLGLSSITRDSRGTVTSKDDRYYMGGSEIIRNSAGDWILRGDSDFSKIEPDSNTSPSYWIITMIDGTRYHYGHVDPESVTKTFTCGNQMDYIRDCNNGMESYLISSWYLDKIEDHSGKNYITFDYSQIIGEVKTNHMDPGTSYEYTQEIYLDRINDVLGNYIKLNYVLKGSNEYFDPWASSSPSAFQEVTGSKEYLEEVITYVNGNIRRERVLLDYNGPNINSVGNTKRLLNELTHFGRDDTISLPPISFEYNDEGETNPSAFDSESFPGALNKIKLPTGGEVSYTYKKQDIVNTPVKSSLNINKALNEYRSFMGNNYIVKLEYQTQNGRYYMDILEPGINGYTSFLSWDFPSTHPSSSDSPPIVFTGDGHFFVVYPDSANPENYKIAVFSEDRYDSDPRWGTGPRDEWAGIPISTDISLVDQFVSDRDGLVYS